MERKIYTDFHTHTMYSDGIETPEILAINLKLNGIDLAAKTDHDTIAGYERFKKAADEIGLRTITGIEFSDKDYHILGLGFDYQDLRFQQLVEQSKYNQRLTTRQRVQMLREHKIPITMEKVESHFPESRLGKHNIFRTFYQDKECRYWFEKNLPGASPSEVFKYTLRTNGLADKVPHFYNLERQEIINGIHEAGGIAILAHAPKDVKNIQELDELREIGIDGYEIQPNFYREDYEAISYNDVKNYAEKNNMLITYGSDYHGASMPRQLLGRGMNLLSPELGERLQLGSRGVPELVV